MCFIKRGNLAPAAGPPENLAAKYTCYRIPIEKMHTDNLVRILDHRYIHEKPLMPVRVRVDIPDFESQLSLDERHQLLDQILTEVATLPAVDLQCIHLVVRQDKSFRDRRRKIAQAARLAQAQAANQQAQAGANQDHCHGGRITGAE